MLPFRHYSTDEGLVNSDVYDIIRDRNGFMWFATDNGLSRFDGLQFKNYSTENGLLSNSLVAVAYKDDTLYISCYRKGVQRMINGVFEKKAYLNYDRISFIRVAKDSVYMFRQATNDAIKSAIFINKNYYKTGIVLFSSNKSTKRAYFEKNLQNMALYKNGVFFRKIPTDLLQEHFFGIDETPDGKLIIGSEGKYFIIEKDNSYQIITSPEIATFKKIDIILKDNKNRIWFRDQYGKAVVEIAHKLYSINQLLKLDEGTAIRNIFLDETNNNIWVATGGKGIFCFYNDFLENYSLSQIGLKNKINTLETDFENRLWIGTQDGFLYQDKNKIYPFHNPMQWGVGQSIYKQGNILYLGYGYNPRGYLISETKFRNQTLLSILSPSVKIDDEVKKRFFILHRTYLSFERKNKLINQSHWYFLNTNISSIGSNKFAYFNADGTYNEELFPRININALKIGSLKGRSILAYFHRNDTTWVGSNKGLYLLVWSKDRKQVREENPFSKSVILANGITNIKADKKGSIYILSEKGLAIWHKNRLFFEVTEFSGIKIVGSACIEFDKHNRMWLGTKQGLFFFDKQKTYVINNKNGLNSSEINAIKYDEINNLIWVGTNNGLSKINITDLEKYHFTSPTLKVSGISTLLGEYFSPSEKNIFSAQQNYLQFHLSASDYISPETIAFEYALDNNNWTKTDSLLILPALSSGNHSINFRVKNDNSDWSKTQKLNFTIAYPFYQNWLFWALISVFLVGFAYWRFENNRSKQQFQLKLKRQIADLKQQSMASMMNPHFIFNALNSIQYYINANDLLLVNEYLAKFGKLIRLNLESSFNNSVSLKNELIFIELYLSLEKLRFGDKFDYQFEIPPSIDTKKILLPPMFIQPFVENALIHGILPSEKKGQILLIIEQKEDEVLQIKIEDNGIGFEAASKLKQSKHTSRSMEIIKQRITIMQEEDNKNSIQFETNTENEGSRVVINLKIKKLQE